jgi:cyclase
MLKKRIVPILLWQRGRLIKTIRFETARDVGDPVKSAAVYNSQLADEIVLLNVERERRDWTTLRSVVRRIAEACFMPLSIGGGVVDYDAGAFLIGNGADKVVVNTAAYRDPDVLGRLANAFGSQAVVVAVDARWDESQGRHVAYSDCGRDRETVGIAEHVRRARDAGAGEFLIQSIDRDGTMTGFDVPLLKLVQAATGAPVIGCGGSGNYDHLRDAFLATNVSALACGSLFNFTDSNPIRAKAFLSNHGLNFKVA